MSDSLEAESTRLRHEVAAIELRMLADGGLIELLKIERERALERLREAEAAEDERRAQEVREAAWAAISSLRGDPWSDWSCKHRRWMSAAVKSRLINMLGRRGYMAFPW